MREKRSQDSGFSWSDVVSLSSLSTDDGEVNCVELSDEYDEYNTDMDLELTTTLTSSESYLEYLHLIQNSAETETKKGKEPLYDSPTESQPLYDSLSSPSAGGGDETLYTNPDLVNDDEEKEALKTELEKTEEEITTLKQVLQAKEKRVHEIKQKLGLTPLNQFQKNVKESWTSIQQSSAYQKTNKKLTTWNDHMTKSSAYNKTKTGLSTASQKTGAAFTSFGSSVSRKMGELKNSTAFKSFEEKTTSFASSVKQAVVGSPKEETSNNSSFEEALNSTAQQQHQQQDEADLASPGSNNKLPEEKLPL
ncbi:tumor protein D52-like isoform X2 [Ptychodera flava]|uniref:tumor protein D52-like isoform X2 n=1 Tax=Ptychodera flava TaxID=63121 RepID=UPI00396A9DBB